MLTQLITFSLRYRPVVLLLAVVLLVAGGVSITSSLGTWWSRVAAWIVEIAATLTPAQRSHLGATLRAYAEDMQALSTS